VGGTGGDDGEQPAPSTPRDRGLTQQPSQVSGSANRANGANVAAELPNTGSGANAADAAAPTAILLLLAAALSLLGGLGLRPRRRTAHTRGIKR